MQIKFVDLAAMNDEIRERVDREMAEIHKNTAYIGGPHVEAFEKEFADFLGVRHVIGVGSGTDALRLALMAHDVGPGDEVITTPMTFIATAASIIQTGATPIFVDVDPETCNLSPEAVRGYLATHKNGNGKPHKRVILPVHLYGLPAAMPELNAIAREYGALVIEDACQAHGARIETPEGWIEAQALEFLRVRLGRVGLRGVDLDDLRHQQTLLRIFAVQQLLHALVGDALVRRMHVHEHDAVRGLREDINAVQLGDCVAERRIVGTALVSGRVRVPHSARHVARRRPATRGSDRRRPARPRLGQRNRA